MSEFVKFLILGILFAIVAVLNFCMLSEKREKTKEEILQFYEFYKDGVFWVKPGYSISTETVEKMSVGRLVDYLERWREKEEKEEEEIKIP